MSTYTIPSRAAVHPHACGGYSSASVNARRDFGSPPRMWGICALRLALSIYYGSPPRMWGICMCPCCSLPVPRFTPTHVGDMVCPHISALLRCGSPPRMWGIFTTMLPIPIWICGSPPRMWGICCVICQSPVAVTVHPHACGGYFFNTTPG